MKWIIEKFIKKCSLLLDYQRRIKSRLIRVRMERAARLLARTKHYQMSTFYVLRKNFSTIRNKLKKYDISQFTTAPWENNNAELEKAFLPYPPFSFLNNRIIAKTMFLSAGGKWLEKQLTFLEKKISRDKLKVILQEDYVGGPLLLNSTYLTSHNSIHHLYHLVRFLDTMHCDLTQVDTIIEWGGGYGNMAKIFQRLKPTPCTYIIIDTPLFSCIQWLYLATIFGKESVNLLQNSDDTIATKKINLIPICFLSSCKLSADLFISTWGLDESSRSSLNYVVSHRWFNSKHFLLAYSSSSFSSEAANLSEAIVDERGVVVECVEFFAGHNQYAFR